MISQVLNIWTRVLLLLENEVTPIGYNTWIKTIKPVSVNEDSFTVSVENNIIKSMVEMRYSELIKNALLEVTSRRLNFNVVLTEQEPMPQTEKGEFPKHMKYTFDNFIVGSGNRFAQAACLAVAEAPAQAYNPLFLYGGVGLGKTHLMHAIKNYIYSNNPDTKITFVSGETFTNEFISSIMENAPHEFRNKYRAVDVLLVDDIQFIAGKERSEEEFFHTFNALHQAGKQIVLTSDRPPKEIKTLESRLVSRFEWGLLCDIQPPDYETRTAILKKRALEDGVVIGDDVLMFIAEKIKRNIRELEGVYNRVVAYKNLIDGEITLDAAKRVVGEYITNDSKQNITPDGIIDYCAKFYRVRKEDLFSSKRTRDISFARQVAIYICREITDLSFPKIGALFNKDHTTVMYAISKIKKSMEEDVSVKNNIESLLKDIRGEI